MVISIQNIPLDDSLAEHLVDLLFLELTYFMTRTVGVLKYCVRVQFKFDTMDGIFDVSNVAVPQFVKRVESFLELFSISNVIRGDVNVASPVVLAFLLDRFMALLLSFTALDDNPAIVSTSGSGFMPEIGTD